MSSVVLLTWVGLLAKYSATNHKADIVSKFRIPSAKVLFKKLILHKIS